MSREIEDLDLPMPDSLALKDFVHGHRVTVDSGTPMQLLHRLLKTAYVILLTLHKC
jgi:hypothetical protein